MDDSEDVRYIASIVGAITFFFGFTNIIFSIIGLETDDESDNWTKFLPVLFGVVYLVISVLLLFGIYLNSPYMFCPYLIIGTIFMIALIIGMIIYTATNPFTFKNLALIVVSVEMTGVFLYAPFVLWMEIRNYEDDS